MSYTILIVDDSRFIVHSLLDILNSHEHNLLYTYSKTEAKKIIRQNEIDILICDLMLPDKSDGLEIIRYFKQINPYSKVLGISAHPEIENIVEMIRTGADDFIPKSANEKIIKQKIQNLKKDLQYKDNVYKIRTGLNDFIIGKSKQIQSILEQIKIIAKNEIESVLIEGESGTGKELVSKTIHKLSPRKNKPFIAINCAGMPDTLVDSELFGFERGSFTGAYHSNQGKFELADEGVLFLDEISEMPVHLQAKLLRVLENREVLRIGGKKAIPINVMVIAATNQDLLQKIKEGTFREDIYFRLSMVKIVLPPLRERKEDIPLLVEYFLNIINERTKRKIQISSEAINLLQQYHFPGNVRELKNIIFNAALFCQKTIIGENFIKKYLNINLETSSLNSFNNKITNLEMIKKTLKQNKGNITQSAKQLGYTREGLSRKLKSLNINIEAFRNQD